MILIALLYRTFSLRDIIINEKERGSVGVSARQLVNLCLHVWLEWCARKTQGVLALVCSRVYKRSREGTGSQVSGG
jgi:hypothetical protein